MQTTRGDRIITSYLELFLKLSRIKAGVVVVEMMGSDLEPSVPGRLAALRAELNERLRKQAGFEHLPSNPH